MNTSISTTRARIRFFVIVALVGFFAMIHSTAGAQSGRNRIGSGRKVTASIKHRAGPSQGIGHNATRRAGNVPSLAIRNGIPGRWGPANRNSAFGAAQADSGSGTLPATGRRNGLDSDATFRSGRSLPEFGAVLSDAGGLGQLSTSGQQRGAGFRNPGSRSRSSLVGQDQETGEIFHFPGLDLTAPRGSASVNSVVSSEGWDEVPEHLLFGFRARQKVRGLESWSSDVSHQITGLPGWSGSSRVRSPRDPAFGQATGRRH